jgi:predicted MPP superfamily phosphohydrolase
MGCWSIAGYLPSHYWYPFILLGREKQVGLSVLLKDTEKQNVTQPRFEPKTSRSEVQHSATKPGLYLGHLRVAWHHAPEVPLCLPKICHAPQIFLKFSVIFMHSNHSLIHETGQELHRRS